jgi:c-di-GMP-binding flagellar brake protein YcgR
LRLARAVLRWSRVRANPHQAERRHPRIKLVAPAFVADEGGVRKAQLLDLSLGGAALVLSEWVPAQAEVTVLVGPSPAITGGLPAVRAEVRWSQSTRQGHTRIGVAFRELSRAAEGRLFALWFNQPTR